MYGPFQRTGCRHAGEGNPRTVLRGCFCARGSTRKLQTIAPSGKASIDVSLFGKLGPFCAQGKSERSVVLTPR